MEGKILGALRLGCFDHVAAEAAGVAYDTFREWVARGEGRDPDRPPAARFAAFAREVRKAKAEARRDAEIELRQTNPLAWLRYGPGREREGWPGWTDRAEVTGPAAGAVEHIVRIIRE